MSTQSSQRREGDISRRRRLTTPARRARTKSVRTASFAAWFWALGEQPKLHGAAAEVERE